MGKRGGAAPGASLPCLAPFAAMAALGALIAGVVGLPARSARAAGFDLDFFKPSPVRTGYFAQESARIVPERTLDLGMAFGYTRQPLVAAEQGNATISGDIIKDRFTGYLLAAFGIGGRFEVGLRVPAVLHQRGDVEVDLSDSGGFVRRPRPSALGDVELLPRMRLLGAMAERGFRLALTAPLGLPTGARDALASDGAISFRPRLIAGWESEKWSTGASAGFEFRRAVEVPSSSLVVGNAVVAGLGAAYMALPYRLWVVGESSVRVGAVQSPTGSGPLTAEALLGARCLLTEQLLIQAGVGTGLNAAAGSPRLRALVMLGYRWGRL